MNRSDITERFGVSVPQASSDLGLYQKMAPENLRYDSRAKRYVAAEDFSPRLIEARPDKYLDQLRAAAEGILALEQTWIGWAPEAIAMPVPARRVDSQTFRTLLKAMREGSSVEALYQSMSQRRPEPEWRRITPHAFGSDGLRWHVRGYCHIDGVFKDFVLSRWREVRAPEEAGAPGSSDRDWSETFEVLLRPNPALSAGQQAAIALEYDMPNGARSIFVRLAMLYYLKKRLRLDVEGDAPSETPIIVENREEFELALKGAKGTVSG